MQRPIGLLLAVATVLLGAGCDEKKTSSDVKADAGTDKYASADPKLAKALQAAASASAASDNGPPPDGIFPQGVADQKHPRGAPTKVDIVSEGSTPQVSLLGTGDAGSSVASSYGPASMTLQMQMGQRTALPSLDLALQLGPAKKDDGGTDWLVAEVKRARAAREQFGALPPDFDKQLAVFDGTILREKVADDGRESDAREDLAKTAPPEFDRFAQNALEALVMDTVPLPAKPVGVGAQWIAETRMALAGVDVIAYRAYRIKSAEGDRLQLSLDVKAYATSADFLLPGLPKGSTLEQFDATAQGDIELVRGETVARKADVQERVILVFSGPGGAQPAQQQGGMPGNVIPVQLQSRAQLVRAEDLRAASKSP